MRTLKEWFAEYGVSHQNPTNILVHKFCVPAIMASVMGMLFVVTIHKGFTLAHLVALAALLYYSILSIQLALGMLIQVAIVFALLHLIPHSFILPGSIAIFILAWIGQFWGHKVEGKKPSFFQDLAFLLIGPLWTLAFLYRRLGIKY